MCSTLRKLLPKLTRSLPGVCIDTIGFALDHVHMLIEIPPKYSIAAVIGQLKSQSSSYLRKKYLWLSKVYWNENIVWSPGYFVSSIGVDEETIKNYIEYQGKQDSGQLRMEL
jgi:putative transposase